MSNDNNLLLIILIGIVMFWICNINTTENFENNNSKTKNIQNKNNQSIEYYRSDKNNEVNADSKRTSSPLLEQQYIDDSALIDKLYAQKQSSNQSSKFTSSDSKSVSGSKK